MPNFFLDNDYVFTIVFCVKADGSTPVRLHRPTRQFIQLLVQIHSHILVILFKVIVAKVIPDIENS